MAEQPKREALKKALEGKGEAEADPFTIIKESLEKAAAGNPHRGLVTAVPGGCEAASLSQERSDMQLQEVKATSVAIRRKLQNMVQASQRRRLWHDTTGREIDANRLAGTVVGDMRIFQHRDPRKQINTAVHLLVDGSSSMGSGPGSAMQVANEAALALALALEATPRILPLVSYFAGNEGDAVTEAVKANQSVRSNAGKFSFVSTGGTPMAGALWKAAQSLSRTREERKMVIVVTDGAPHDGAKVQHVLGLMQRSGYEVMAIGIRSAAVAGYFKHYCVIQDVTDLKRTLFGMVQDKLVA